MVHDLKFKSKELCDAVYAGIKTFEIRKNDRNYQVGDIIRPIPIDEDESIMVHPLRDKMYIVTYVVKEWSNILKDGYCVFSIKEL